MQLQGLYDNRDTCATENTILCIVYLKALVVKSMVNSLLLKDLVTKKTLAIAIAKDHPGFYRQTLSY